MYPTRSSSHAAFAWIWALPSLAISILIAVLVAPLLARSPDLGRLGELFLSSTVDDCRPEPLEQIRYVLVIGLSPLVYLTGLLVARRRPDRESANFERGALASQVVLAVGALAVWAYSEIYVVRFFRGHPILIALALILVFWRWLIRIFGKTTPDHWGWGVAALAYFFVKFLPSLLTTGGLHQVLHYVSYHLSFALNEFAAVSGGLSPFVDFHPQYQNVLPLLLAPVFRRTGVGVTGFSVVMIALTFASVLCVHSIFRRVAGSRKLTFVLIVPFLAMCTVPFIHERDMRVNMFSYYAVGPLRYFFPFLSALVCSLILRRPEGREGARTFLVFVVATVGAINNLDFGLPSLVAVAATLGIAQRRWKRLVVAGSLGVAAGVGLVASLVLASSGHWPEWSQLGEYQRIFAVYGYFMLPIPGIGLYWIVVATFLAALAVPLVRRVLGGTDDSVDRRHLDGMLTYSAVFGCGAMMYYVGRSHPIMLYAMFPAWAFSLLLLLARQVRVGAFARGTLLGKFERIPLALTGLMYVVMLTTVFKFSSPTVEIGRIFAKQGAFERRFSEQVSVLRSLSTPADDIMVIAPFGHMLAAEAGRRNVFPYAEGESLILKRQIREIAATLEVRHVGHVFGVLSPEVREVLLELGFKPGTSRSDLEVWTR